jgi:hypothetical protein
MLTEKSIKGKNQFYKLQKWNRCGIIYLQDLETLEA